METSSFSTKQSKKISPFTAKKDHEIHQNDTHLIFKKGEKYSDIDVKWKSTLKVEKII